AGRSTPGFPPRTRKARGGRLRYTLKTSSAGCNCGGPAWPKASPSRTERGSADLLMENIVGIGLAVCHCGTIRATSPGGSDSAWTYRIANTQSRSVRDYASQSSEPNESFG